MNIKISSSLTIIMLARIGDIDNNNMTKIGRNEDDDHNTITKLIINGRNRWGRDHTDDENLQG